MPILHLADRAAIEAAPALATDPELGAILAVRARHLAAGGLLDMTEIAVVTAETSEADLVEAVGFTPLVDRDGRRYGQPGFCAFLDYVARVGARYHEAIVAVGSSGFAFQLLVRDDADPMLVALCRELAAEAPGLATRL